MDPAKDPVLRGKGERGGESDNHNNAVSTDVFFFIRAAI